MNSIHYSAAWTDSGCYLDCGHHHENVSEAASCIPCAGGYVVGVEDGVMRALKAEEEDELQYSIRANSRVVQTTSAVAARQTIHDTGYAVMTRIRVGNCWTWTTWMSFETYAEAASCAREDNKVVRFGSAEWAALRAQTEPALPICIDAPRESQSPRDERETLLEFVLRFLSRYCLDHPPAHSSNASSDSKSVGFQYLESQPSQLSGTVFDEQTIASGKPVGMVDFLLNWLDKWEMRNLESMYSKHVPLRLDSIGKRLHCASKHREVEQPCIAEDMVKPPNRERRVNLEKRRRVAEMSPEEMMRELLTSGVTGLPNRRAFDEAEVTPAVAMSDVDGLKALNDHYGYVAGNALLKAKADALRQAGLEAYHDKGDEFLYRGNSIGELQANLQRASAILSERTILVERADGSKLRFTGADFSFGVGKDIYGAELGLKRCKAERKARGEPERRELRGIVERERPGIHHQN